MDFRSRYLRLCTGLCIASLAIQGCKDPNRESVWNGTWKLNVSESQAYGGYFTLGIAPDGVVTVTNEAYTSNFECNSKEFKNGAGHSIVCTPLNSRQWKLTTRTDDGKDTGTSVWEVSSDGKTLTVLSNELQADGTRRSNEITYTRRAGTNGFAGRWQNTTPLKSHPRILDIALNGKLLHLAYPEIGQYSDSPLDGSIVPLHGPRVQPGSSISVKAMSSREFYSQLIFSGRVIRKVTMNISEDGRTLVQESWASDNPNERDRLVYNKQ